MTYAEAKVIVGGGPFVATYSRLKKAEKRFKNLWECGAFSSTDFHVAKSTMTFEDIKDLKEPFRSGSTNVFRTLIENDEDRLKEIEEKTTEYLFLAEAYCKSIRNGMDMDTSALAAADMEYNRVYDSLAPHQRAVYDDKGNPTGEMIDTSAEDAATAHDAAEKVWYGSCCAWSK